MIDSNKENVIKKINSLKAGGGTNIYSGLQRALGLITQDYLSGNKVASMILLSDGYDGKSNADTNFRSLINSQKKNNYAFTLHTLGYGDNHQADLLNP